MKTVTFLLALLLCVLLPGTAHGQCQIQTYASYAVSFSDAISSDGNDILASVVVEGSASMQMLTPCPDAIITQFNNNKQNIMHYPSMLNQVGSVGGWSSGSAACAECYIYSQSNADSGPVSPGQLVSATYGGQVNCSVAGGIFSSLSSLFHLETAYTRFITGTYTLNGGLRYYTITPYCTAQTSPPDWSGAGAHFATTNPPIIPTDVVDGKTVCLRIGNSGPWACPPAGLFTGGSWNLPWPLGICTHNP